MVYKVKRQFTDNKGKAWKPGEEFTGDQAEIDRHVRSGNVEDTDRPDRSGGKDERGGGEGAPT